MESHITSSSSFNFHFSQSTQNWFWRFQVFIVACLEVRLGWEIVVQVTRGWDTTSGSIVWRHFPQHIWHGTIWSYYFPTWEWLITLLLQIYFPSHIGPPSWVTVCAISSNTCTNEFVVWPKNCHDYYWKFLSGERSMVTHCFSGTSVSHGCHWYCQSNLGIPCFVESSSCFRHIHLQFEHLW
jgi:hypothetical protein